MLSLNSPSVWHSGDFCVSEAFLLSRSGVNGTLKVLDKVMMLFFILSFLSIVYLLFLILSFYCLLNGNGFLKAFVLFCRPIVGSSL